ncbi:MAG: ATP-binding protein [Rhodopseudomonas palustris]|nr:ATP-binding protein [Rhodopseudomonas palustris]
MSEIRFQAKIQLSTSRSSDTGVFCPAMNGKRGSLSPELPTAVGEDGFFREISADSPYRNEARLLGLSCEHSQEVLLSKVNGFLDEAAFDTAILDAVLGSRSCMIDALMRITERVVDRLPYIDEENRGYVFLFLNEAISNAVYHGNLKIPKECRTKSSFKEYEKEMHEYQPSLLALRVTLRIVFDPVHFEMQVTDSGDGFDFKKRLRRNHPPAPDQESGRGIFILKKVADAITFYDKGKTLYLRKRWRN